MEWRKLLYEFVAALIVRIAPTLINAITEWLGGQSDEQKVALVDGVMSELIKIQDSKIT